MNRPSLLLLLVSSLALGSCAAGLAMSAANVAVRGARGTPQSNEHLRPTAVQACSAHASQFGEARIIDVEQRSASKIIVWGTVSEGEERRSFQCHYGTKITRFQLREIKPLR
jgi:hypothetical protein